MKMLSLATVAARGESRDETQLLASRGVTSA
jgi:hypothetical protein